MCSRNTSVCVVRGCFGLGRRNDDDRSGQNGFDGLLKLGNEPAQIAKPRIESVDYDDSDGELRDILLVTHPFVRGNQNLERRRRMTKKGSVLKPRPALFLNSSDDETRQITPKLPWHVLVEEYSPHAI